MKGGSGPDQEDENSVSSLDDDLQSKCSRRAIVNLQKLLDNVTAEIDQEKKVEEGVELPKRSDQEEGEKPEEGQKDAVDIKEPELEKEDADIDDKEDIEDDGDMEEEDEEEEDDEEELMEEDKVQLPQYDFKNITSVETEDQDDEEVCTPPKLHKELAFLNQEVSMISSTPELSKGLASPEAHKMKDCYPDTKTKDEGDAAGSVENSEEDVEDDEDEILELMGDESGDDDAFAVLPQKPKGTGDEDEDEYSIAMPQLPKHLRLMSEQLSQELEEETKKHQSDDVAQEKNP